MGSSDLDRISLLLGTYLFQASRPPSWSRSPDPRRPVTRREASTCITWVTRPNGNRRATYAYNFNSMWTDPSADDLHETMNREFAAALAPFSTGGVCVNFLGVEGDARIRAAYGDAKYEASHG